ncbi:MAG: cytochrome c oxidase accessory protein CcoG [Gammaproteobacteria bacterium]|nr:cytochrome c oxidase accessory protein CcoG [Gammaproteobacteria bacterium]
MSNDTGSPGATQIDALYDEQGHWHINTGEKTIHAKRMPGRFRRLKWFTASVWLIFFLGPYLRWGERQAIILDIPQRKFQIFDITILPQDVWMLSLVLLFFAILLAVVTSVAGRVFCGYFCFQTVWTDIFTLIEERLEGSPAQRHKLDKAPWDGRKLLIKGVKHALWIAIGILTGITFTLWFGDAYEMWRSYFALDAAPIAWGTVATFAIFTYLFGGFMREQVCFWLCPYARIQGVMMDAETIVPAYDFNRGEPRARLKKGEAVTGTGDCIECNQCIAVCPTGIDIREGQQEGCITCGLCLDACDSVMSRINKPRGLIRYSSLDALQGVPHIPLLKRPRILIYLAILLLSVAGIYYGLTHLGTLELKVIHSRAPLFVQMSDGTIQNKYDLKILNKLDHDIEARISASGPPGLELVDGERLLTLKSGRLTSRIIYIKVASSNLDASRLPLTFTVQNVDNPEESASYDSAFFSQP